ncbi:MAG: glycosyltransferase [Eubacteriales bacterium]|nr:glycosyltransferase [Eubacteriales bacterium]
MLIGQFCETYPPTLDGVGRVMLSYCQGLHALGHRALYIAPYNPLYPEQVDYETLLYEGTRIPGESYRIGAPRLSKNFRSTVKELKFDVLHAHSPFLAGREARRIALRDGAPLIATFHSKYYDDFYKATGSKTLAKIGVRYAIDFYHTCDEVWTVNAKTAEVLQSYGYRGDVVLMPNGTDLYTLSDRERRETAERFPLQQGVPTLIFTGQQNRKKNTESILRACALLKGEGFDFQLVMVGEGPDAHFLHALSRELGIADNVLFTGFLSDRPTLMALYEHADLMVFPSIYDNAPMVVREAAAMGTPALLVAGSCAAEGVTHGENGYLCQNTVEEIARGIIDALPTAREVGLRAQESIPIPWNRLMERVVSRYQERIAHKAEGDCAWNDAC